MNSLNALGNRHIASLNADIAKMENGEGGPSVQCRSPSLEYPACKIGVGHKLENVY